MYTNVNLLAPVGVLAFLGTGFVMVVAGLVLIHALLTRRTGRAKLFLLAIVLSAGIYFGAMLIFSFASSETALARGQEKHFCEIDCHLAYSVVDVNQSKTLGNPPNQITAAGMYNALTIKTRFDETTISAHRGNGLLYPNSRVLTVIDAEGRKYFPATEAQRAFEQSKDAGIPLTTPLRPANRQGFQCRHIACASHYHVRLQPAVAAGPLPDPKPTSAVGGCCLDIQVVEARLLAGDDDVDVVAAAKAVVGDRQAGCWCQAAGRRARSPPSCS